MDYRHNKSFGVIAHPTNHAPMVFNQLFAERSLDHVMVPISVPPSDFTAMIRPSPSLICGLTATIPHKMAMADLCDTLGPAARVSGAVNAVRFNADGTIDGDNFDGEGFVAGMISKGHEITGRIALLLGQAVQRAPSPPHCVPMVSGAEILNRTHVNAAALVSALEDKGGFEQACGDQP